MTAVIKYLTTRFYIRRFRDAPMRDYRSAAAQCKRFLIHATASSDTRQLATLLNGIRGLYPDARIDFLLPTDCPVELRNAASLFSRDLHFIGKGELRFSKVVRQEIVEKLRQRNFDVVIDLSRAFDVTFAHAMRESGAPLVMTRYRDGDPQVFHNLFVRTTTDAQFHEHACRCLAQLKS